ncbi:MAG: hypothetical protein IE881_01390 [Epsilonproteobacteria bacterium]|nr:hypothetical protein [Campylobacterota bacterium]
MKIENMSIDEIKQHINRLLQEYRERKDNLDYVMNDWEIAEEQEALSLYAVKIKRLKARLHELGYVEEQDNYHMIKS